MRSAKHTDGALILVREEVPKVLFSDRLALAGFGNEIVFLVCLQMGQAPKVDEMKQLHTGYLQIRTQSHQMGRLSPKTLQAHEPSTRLITEMDSTPLRNCTDSIHVVNEAELRIG